MFNRFSLLNVRNKSSGSVPTLLSSDMARELERQRCENKEIETMEEKEGPIHYANVRHNG